MILKIPEAKVMTYNGVNDLPQTAMVFVNDVLRRVVNRRPRWTDYKALIRQRFVELVQKFSDNEGDQPLAVNEMIDALVRQVGHFSNKRKPWRSHYVNGFEQLGAYNSLYAATCKLLDSVRKLAEVRS